MALVRRPRMNRSMTRISRPNNVVRFGMLIPEAPLLMLVVSLAWALRFPPLLGLLAVAIGGWFLVRTMLLLGAEQCAAHGDEQRAEQLAQVALRMHPWSVDVLLLRAQILMRRGQHAAADALLRRAAWLDARHGDVQAARATNLLAQGVVSHQPVPSAHDDAVSPALLYHYARVALHAEHDAAKAVDLIRQAAPDRLPAATGVPLLLLLGEAYIAQERVGDARATLQHCEAQLGRCGRVQRAEASYQLGCLWQALGNDGTVWFRRSVELDAHGRYAHAAWRGAVTGK